MIVQRLQSGCHDASRTRWSARLAAGIVLPLVLFTWSATGQVIVATGFEPAPDEDPGYTIGDLEGQLDWLVLPGAATAEIQSTITRSGAQALALIDGNRMGRARHALDIVLDQPRLVARCAVLCPTEWEQFESAGDRFEGFVRLGLTNHDEEPCWVDFGFIKTLEPYGELPADTSAYFVEVGTSLGVLARSYQPFDPAGFADVWHAFRLELDCSNSGITLVVDGDEQVHLDVFGHLGSLTGVELRNERWGTGGNNEALYFDDTCVHLSEVPSYAFAINREAEQIVRVDVSNGDTLMLADLEMLAENVDLAFQEDTLYGISSQRFSGAELFQIDRATGATSVLAAVTHGGEPVTHAEGLTSVSGELIIGFHDGTNPNPSVSNAIGFVGLDGVIVDAMDIGIDIDGLAADRTTGDLLVLDTRPNTEKNLLYRVRLEPLEVELVTALMTGPDYRRLNDIAMLGTELFAVSHDDGVIHRIDLLTGQLMEAIAAEQPGWYMGIVVEPLEACPGDFTGDGVIDTIDLLGLILNWGPCEDALCRADVNDDGMVNVDDLTALMFNWGSCP
ncbi:MAG: dockerin type I repeat-containing protein [Planctomycetota bacterium]|jgi:hypothetical protein